MIKDIFDSLKHKYHVQTGTIYISEVCIGAFLTGVRLSNGAFGMASTYLNPNLMRSGKRNPDAPFAPGKIRDKFLEDLFVQPKDTPFIQSIQVAALNALSAPFLADSDFLEVHQDTDPVTLIDLTEPVNITIVGAFKSYIRMFRDSKHTLRVLERKPEVLKNEDALLYRPAHTAPEVLADSDLIIITGSAMINESLEELLSLSPKDATLIVTGPSSSFIPDLLFEKGVDYIGATRLYDADRMMDVIAQAGSGYHLFRNGGAKITLSPKGR